MDAVEFKFPDEKENETFVDELDGKADAGDTTEVEIEVVDDTPEQDRDAGAPIAAKDVHDDEVTDEDLKKYSEKNKVKIKQRLASLTRGYHDERRAKEAADRERQEALRLAQSLVDENNKLKERVNQNQSILTEQAKRVAVGDVDKAKAAFKLAYESGDSEALALAQENLTAAKIKADRVANIKLPPLQPTNPVVLSQQVPRAPEVDTRAVEWQKANQWFNGQSKSDKFMTKFALAVHTSLVEDEGIDPRTDAYYDALNSRMRQFFPGEFSDASVDEKPKRASVVSPVTRGVAPRKITLTKTQVALAKRLGVPLELYAKQVAEEMRKNHG